jgi:hypothetical protein
VGSGAGWRDREALHRYAIDDVGAGAVVGNRRAEGVASVGAPHFNRYTEGVQGCGKLARLCLGAARSVRTEPRDDDGDDVGHGGWHVILAFAGGKSPEGGDVGAQGGINADQTVQCAGQCLIGCILLLDNRVDQPAQVLTDDAVVQCDQFFNKGAPGEGPVGADLLTRLRPGSGRCAVPVR